MKQFVLNQTCNHPMCMLLTMLMSMITFTSRAQVAINETNFPDENFRKYLLAQSYGEDGVLTDEEIKEVAEIDVGSKISSDKISSLKGIEHFTALETLICYNNQLTALDVSNNMALEMLWCAYNQLTALDVSNNTALEVLACDYNQLTALDVSNNTALKTLSCIGNQLTALDVSKNMALEGLFCVNNQLTALDVSENTALENLWFGGNQLTALDLSKNPALQELSCPNNQLTALDVSNNTALKTLSCNGNQLTALDVSKNMALEGLSCYNNQINGAAMDALISSLPENTGESISFLVIYNDEETIDGNVCTKVQVATAIAKGWQPMEWKNGMWMPCEGNDATDHINTAVISSGPQSLFTLSGQRLAAPRKGLNIRGGKKIVVK